MKLTNRQMINMHAALTAIGAKEGIDCVLGVSIARNNYELMKMTEPVNNEKEKLLDKYGKHDEKGKLVTVNGGQVVLEDAKKYNEEYERLMEAEGEVALTQFAMSDIKKMSPTPNQIMHLLPIMAEKEKKK